MAENLLQTCGTIFTVELPACVQSIVVNGDLTPSTSYYFKITDKHGNKYSNSATTDINGDFIISATDFIKGLFNPYAGAFLLEVFSSSISCSPLNITLCGNEYSAVSMTFANVFTESVLSTFKIGCCDSI